MVLTFREGKRKTRVSAKVGLGIGENVEWSGVEWAFDSQKHKRRVSQKLIGRESDRDNFVKIKDQ